MKWIAKLLFLAAVALTLFLISGTASAAPGELGPFANIKLLVDTQIEAPPVNNNVTTHRLLLSGESVQFQLFAPAAAGVLTWGYAITFDGVTDFHSPSGRDMTGSPLILAFDGTPAALLITQPSIGPDGYLGEVTLMVSRDLSDGSVLQVSSFVMSDPSRDLDYLDVSSATITFTSGQGSAQMDGDFDLDGDVDFVDFLRFAQNFGKTGPAPTQTSPGMDGDFDLDGDVDFSDFITFAQNFGRKS